MKKSIYKCLALILVINIICVGNVSAVARSSKYFSIYTTSAQSDSDGQIIIKYTVASPSSMQELGVSIIYIYESTDNGRSWSSFPVSTYIGSTLNGMLVSNSTYHSSFITYSGIVGYMYKASVTFYASNSAGSETSVKETGSVSAN